MAVFVCLLGTSIIARKTRRPSHAQKTMVIREGLAPKVRVLFLSFCETKNGEGRSDVVARLCLVVDWYIDHPEYTAKIKVIPKKDYPVL